MKAPWFILILCGVLQGSGCFFDREEQETIVLNRIPFIKVQAGSFLPGDPSDQTSLSQKMITLSNFYMCLSEITVEQYSLYLNKLPEKEVQKHPQFIYKNRRYTPKKGMKRHAVAHIAYNDAVSFSSWISKKTGKHITLPSEYEWEHAARGNIHQAPYAWGWGNPNGRAAWNLDTPLPIKTFDANKFGFYDMSGGVYEWCLISITNTQDAVARGGAWSETDPAFITIFKRTLFAVNYRGADVGFRLVYHPKQN